MPCVWSRSWAQITFWRSFLLYQFFTACKTPWSIGWIREVVLGGRNMHLTEPSRLLSSSGCAEQLSINNRAFGERMFCKHWWRLTAGTNSSKPLGKNFWIHPHISLRLIDHRECIHVYVFKASWLRRFPQQISTTVQLVKEIAKFFNESTLGEQDSGWKESASKTNQEADDRLFWPMLLENQLRKRSTNRTIQQGRLPRIFSRKISKFRA